MRKTEHTWVQRSERHRTEALQSTGERLNRSLRDWKVFEQEDGLDGTAIISRGGILEVVDTVYGVSIADLKEINFPKIRKSWFSNSTGIGCAAFAQSEIKRIEIPEGIQIIGPYAFWGCEQLEEVVLPRSLKAISDDAFGYCRRLIAPNLRGCPKLVSIGERAFYGCSGKDFDSLKFPRQLREIGAFAFGGCDSLTGIRLDRKLRKLGYGAFSSCRELERVRGLRERKLEVNPEVGFSSYSPLDCTLARCFLKTPWARKRKLNECFRPDDVLEERQYCF